MEVVRELRRKQDELRSDRQALIDKIAKIDTDIGSVDTVIQIYEPDHTPTKAKTRRAGTLTAFLGGLFADDNLSARILNTLRLAQTPISSHECAIRVASQKNVPEDAPECRTSRIALRSPCPVSRSLVASSRSKASAEHSSGRLPPDAFTTQ
jgi:hypothetical protein